MFTHSSTPNQIRSMPSLARHRRQQRHDDEGDLEEVEEEREEEDEEVDEDQEADLRRPAGPTSRCSIQSAAVDALEHQREHGRADQDEDHHRGDAHGRLHRPAGPAARSAAGACAARTIAPTAPMAPASVGVARPMKIVPSTRKISTTEGIMPHSTRLHSAQPLQRARLGRQRRHRVRPEDATRRR